MSFLVATNVVASRPPESRPTGTPHARAKITKLGFKIARREISILLTFYFYPSELKGICTINVVGT